jgi:myosin heavy subunit
LVFRKELSKNNEEMAIPVNKEYLASVVKLLCVDYEPFEFSFQYRTRKLGASIINSPLRFDEAIALQSSFAKNIYEKAFFFIVGKLNQKI